MKLYEIYVGNRSMVMDVQEWSVNGRKTEEKMMNGQLHVGLGRKCAVGLGGVVTG